VQPLERAYYMGVLTLLLVQRNALPQPPPPQDGAWPAQPRIYQTGMGSAWAAPSSLTRRKRGASLFNNFSQVSQGALHSWGIHRHRTHAALVLGLRKLPQYRCRLGCILVIWVAFFARRQRYCG